MKACDPTSANTLVRRGRPWKSAYLSLRNSLLDSSGDSREESLERRFWSENRPEKILLNSESLVLTLLVQSRVVTLLSRLWLRDWTWRSWRWVPFITSHEITSYCVQALASAQISLSRYHERTHIYTASARAARRTLSSPRSLGSTSFWEWWWGDWVSHVAC